MSTYKRQTLPGQYEAGAIEREFERVEQAMRLFDFLLLGATAVAPPKPQNGEVRYANGSTWNPGSGEGIYGFYAGSWKKLG